jgi:hypothetical protein
VIVAVLIVDISILRIARSGGWQYGHDWQSVIIFILMSLTFAVAQYFILRYVKTTGEKELRFTRKSKQSGLVMILFRKGMWVIQYFLTAILGLVILEIVLYSYYNSTAVTTAATFSYVTGFVIMGLLSFNLFRWFNRNRSRKSDLTVFLYAISSAALAINTAIALAMTYELSQHKPEIVRSHSATVYASAAVRPALDSAYTITSTLGFISMWIATVIILRSYAHKLGQIRYWFLVSIPLVYFVSQFLTLFLNQLAYVIALYSIFFNLLFVLSKPVGGILFGAALWAIAKSSISRESIVRDYLILAAIGVMLFFVSSRNTAAEMAYPPFGLIGALFVGLSAYMMFLGLYSTAISVSHDAKLRQSIRRSATKESELLDSIGSAQMEQELQNRVLKLVKEQSDRMMEETGIQPSLGENEIKEYLDMVVNEIKSAKQ